MRVLAVAALGVLAGCGTTTVCGPETCGGCCDAQGQCVDGTTASACGKRGGTCFDCGATLTCGDGVCVGGTGGGAGGGAGGGGGAGDWKTDTVNRHNYWRGAAIPTPNPALPPMSWSAAAEAQAVSWAANCRFEHSTSNNFGENLFAGSVEYDAAFVVDDWASERADYDYATDTCAPGKACGHYTQLVWRSSTGVGCARRTCTVNSPFGGGTGTWFLEVCNYAPPGNYVGQKPY